MTNEEREKLWKELDWAYIGLVSRLEDAINSGPNYDELAKCDDKVNELRKKLGL